MKAFGAFAKLLRDKGSAARSDSTKDPANAGSPPAGASFPQLEVATDTERMREVFEKHLRAFGEEDYRVVGCRIFQTRHQQDRLMVQYVLGLAQPCTGRERRQRVTGTVYAEGRTRDVWEGLRHTKPVESDLADASPTFTPYSYIPDLDMLVQVFPYDHKLPALPVLMAGPPPELTPPLLARFGPGDWRVEGWKAKEVRYLAEMRATLRLTVRARDAGTGGVEEKRFYAKVYGDGETGEQSHEVLRALWGEAPAGGASFTVGRPVAYLGDLRTLVQEEVVGASLQDMLLRGEDVTEEVRKVARALASLHLSQTPTPRHRPPQRDVAIVERAGEVLPLACPHLRSEIEEVVGAVVAGLEEVPPASPSHCDLSPNHIRFDGDRIVLIDLDEFAGADPMLDVARLLTPLANASLRFPLSEELARTASVAFVEEYFAHAPEAWRPRLPLYYAIAVFKMALGFYRRQKPGFRDNIEVLVEEARGALAGEIDWLTLKAANP